MKKTSKKTKETPLSPLTCSALHLVRSPYDKYSFTHEGFNLLARVEADDQEADENAPDGYVGVTLEAFSCGVRVGGASLWGIDSLANGYTVDVVRDLIPEALDDARKNVSLLVQSALAASTKALEAALAVQGTEAYEGPDDIIDAAHGLLNAIDPDGQKRRES